MLLHVGGKLNMCSSRLEPPPSMLDPQLQARLFQAPTEIRRAIYASLIPGSIHIFRQQETFCFSRCVTPSPCRDDSGFERRTMLPYDVFRDTTWQSRLRSLWGPHWKCEEALSSAEGDAEILPLLLVCRRMYEDIADYLSETATFHIADIGTLESLVRQEPKDMFPKNLVAVTFYSIRKLYVTARLPLQVCEAIEGASEDLEAQSSATLWKQVWLEIVNLKSLRMLEVEIDHTDRASWSVANERAIVSPLTPLAALPQLKVVLILPKLHPFYESPDRHFTEDSVESSVAICRRVRQHFHATENVRDAYFSRLVTESCYDRFPILPDIYGLPDANGKSLSPEELKKVEEDERAMWKSGEDVHLYILTGRFDVCRHCNPDADTDSSGEPVGGLFD